MAIQRFKQLTREEVAIVREIYNTFLVLGWSKSFPKQHNTEDDLVIIPALWMGILYNPQHLLCSGLSLTQTSMISRGSNNSTLEDFPSSWTPTLVRKTLSWYCVIGVLSNWFHETSAGKDATETFYGLHRHEVLEQSQYQRLKIGAIAEEKSVIHWRVSGTISKVPYAEPTWLAEGYHSPYFSDVSAWIYLSGLFVLIAWPFPLESSYISEAGSHILWYLHLSRCYRESTALSDSVRKWNVIRPGKLMARGPRRASLIKCRMSYASSLRGMQ